MPDLCHHGRQRQTRGGMRTQNGNNEKYHGKRERESRKLHQKGQGICRLAAEALCRPRFQAREKNRESVSLADRARRTVDGENQDQESTTLATPRPAHAAKPRKGSSFGATPKTPIRLRYISALPRFFFVELGRKSSVNGTVCGMENPATAMLENAGCSLVARGHALRSCPTPIPARSLFFSLFSPFFFPQSKPAAEQKDPWSARSGARAIGCG